MDAGTSIPYVEAIARAIWNYFRLTDYVKLRYSVYRHGETFYDDVGDLWKDAIDKRTNADGDLKLLDGRVVKLIGFNFSEWVPWAPGMYWTPYGSKLRELAREYRENRAEMLDKMSQFMDPEKVLLMPWGKTLSVISGVGAVRLAQHMTQDGKIKVLGATTYDREYHGGGNPRANASAGIPVVMHESAYDKIKENVVRRGVVKATVEGHYIEIPKFLADTLHRAVQVPRFCIYVGSGLMTTDENQREDDVSTAGWSLCEGNNTNDYSMALYHFAATNLDGSAEAGRFLTNYINEYEGTALTDFDEVQPSMMGAFPITEIVNGNIDLRKLRILQQKIGREIPIV